MIKIRINKILYHKYNKKDKYNNQMNMNKMYKIKIKFNDS